MQIIISVAGVDKQGRLRSAIHSGKKTVQIAGPFSTKNEGKLAIETYH